jgi:integrase
MDSTVASLLADCLQHPTSELVFANKAGGRFLEIRGGFQNACERAGLSDLHFHDLRHTFASHWMMAAGDLYILKNLLGHKTIGMTERYSHLSPEFKRTAVNRMDNIWNNVQAPQIGAAEAPSADLRSLSGHQQSPPPVSR